MRIPSGVEVVFEIVLVLLASEVLELFDDQSGSLISLVLLYDFDSVVTVYRELLEDILQVLIVCSGIELLLSQRVSLVCFSLEGLLKFHLVQSLLQLVGLLLLCLLS